MHGDVERFDAWAESYDRHWLQRFLFAPVQKTVLDMAAGEVPQPASILDVGCGTGRLLRAAETRFPAARLEGVDAAPGMVSHAQSSLVAGSRIRFQQGTAEALPFADGAFDLVFSTLTFHHWSDQVQGIREVRRVLAPGGRWLLADFVPTGVAARVVRALHATMFPSRAVLDGMLAGAGLSVVARASAPRTMGNVQVLSIALERAMGIEPT